MSNQHERQTVPVIFLSVHPGIETAFLAANVAAIIGVVARRKTLLLDLSDNKARINTCLGISADHNLLNLVAPFLRDGRISVDDLAKQVQHYEPGGLWADGISALDALPGFDRSHLSPAEMDRLSTYREVELVNAVYESAKQAGYEFVLADGGAWPKAISGMGVGLSSKQGWAILVSTDQEQDMLSTERPIQFLRNIGWNILGVFTCTREWQFKLGYGDAPFLKGLAYITLPLEKRGAERAPMALLDLQDAKRPPGRFTKALIDIALRLEPGLRKTLLDSQGRPL